MTLRTPAFYPKDYRIVFATAVVLLVHWIAWTLAQHHPRGTSGGTPSEKRLAATVYLRATSAPRAEKAPELKPPPAAQAAVRPPAHDTDLHQSANVPREGGNWPDEFIPASALTRPPQVQHPPELFFPVDVEPGRYAMTVTVYIDDLGFVQRVDVSGDNLPPSMIDSVKLAFLQSMFSPGQLHGTNVRSMTTFEVVFDDAGAPLIPEQP